MKEYSEFLTPFRTFILFLIFGFIYMHLEQIEQTRKYAASTVYLSEQLSAISCSGTTPDGDPANSEVLEAGIGSTPKGPSFIPITGASVNNDRVEYIKRFWKTAVAEQKNFGVPASISLAQGCLESGNGKSVLALKANNHFGVKCMYRSCPRGHCVNRADDSHKDFFVKYRTPWESWRAHSKLLTSKKYRSLKKHGLNYEQWALGLKKKGYATDRNYANSLIKIIKTYKLYVYDNM